jgi:hypothetical protein
VLSWRSGLAGALVVGLLLGTSGCKGEEGLPRSTGDPSPRVDTRAEAERFAPAVWLATSEQNMPMDASRFVAESRLMFHHACRNRLAITAVAGDVDEARLGGHGEGPYLAKTCDGGELPSDESLDAGPDDGLGFYLDLADEDEVRRGDGPNAPVYWEYYEKGDGRTTAFVYWLFYGYNDYINNHEGDWERVAVQLVDGEPDALIFWRHNEGPCRVGWSEAETRSGHPVTYAAVGSHGSYHRAGSYPVHSVATALTDVTTAGTPWSTWDTVRPVVDQPWWEYRGLWGVQQGVDGSNGPRGPYPGRAESVFAERPCAGPEEDAPETTDTDVPPVEGVPAQFQGRWTSPEPAEQPTSDKTYHVQLTIHDGAVGEQVGDISYPGLDCSGSLRLVEARPNELVVAEHIDEMPKGPCTVDGFVTLTPTADGLHFEYERRSEPGDVAVRAELTR